MKELLLDTNVLLLVLIGRKYPERVGGKRLEQFEREDLFRALEIVGRFGRQVTIPNILTETSNLLGDGKQWIVPDATDLLRVYVSNVDEIYWPSAKVVATPAYSKVGLTDAAILEASSGETTVVTVDYRLQGLLSDRRVDVINLMNFKTFRR